jgi:hypothetical protein
LLRALQIAATLATTGVPAITLSSDREFRRKLRQYKHHGFLGTTKLQPEDLSRLRQVLTNFEPQALYSSPNPDGFHLIVDTGCSVSATACLDDFLPNTLTTLQQPVEMEGIAGGLVIKQQGRVRYELLTDDGNVHELETTAYYMPELPCRLFSPQAHFQGLYQSGLDPRQTCDFAIKRNVGKITWETGSTTTVNFCETTHLPRLRVYRKALESAKALALKGCVTNEVNQNLTAKQKLALRFHFRLGHISFQHVQWLGRQGVLGPEGVTMGKDAVATPKCAACQFGKQTRTPTPGRRVSFDDGGALTKDQINPGQKIFVDQYESRAPGRTFASKGASSSLNMSAVHYFMMRHRAIFP